MLFTNLREQHCIYQDFRIGCVRSPKFDALPKCECSALRQELSELKSLVGKPVVDPTPISSDETYSAVKKALNDATVFAEKSMRAVWVGRRPESTSPEETSRDDRKGH